MPNVNPKRLVKLEAAEREVEDYHNAARILARYQAQALAGRPFDDPWRVGWTAFARAWRDAIIDATNDRLDREARASDL